MQILFFLLLPGLVLLVEEKGGLFKNVFDVLLGRKSWVGYNSGDLKHLPAIKKGILSPEVLFPEVLNNKKRDELNVLYAKNYRLMNDLEIVLKGLKKIGKS